MRPEIMPVSVSLLQAVAQWGRKPDGRRAESGREKGEVARR